MQGQIVTVLAGREEIVSQPDRANEDDDSVTHVSKEEKEQLTSNTEPTWPALSAPPSSSSAPPVFSGAPSPSVFLPPAQLGALPRLPSYSTQQVTFSWEK